MGGLPRLVPLVTHFRGPVGGGDGDVWHSFQRAPRGGQRPWSWFRAEAHVTSVLGTAEQSSRCHGSRWREPTHWLLEERRKKRPAVSGVVCLVPACHCFQSAAGSGTLTEHAAGRRGPQGPPATAVYTTGGMGAPRSMSLVSPSSVKSVKDKSRAYKEKWAAFSFTLNSSELSFLL